MSHLDQTVETPRSWWFALLVGALFVVGLFALACPGADAAEAKKVTVALYGWKLAVIDHDGQAYRRGGDLFGGRAIGSVDLSGGLHLGMRGDASALSSSFDPKNPSTWRTVETRAALSRPFALGPLTAGPAVMAGAVIPVTTEASWSSRADFGGGARLARGDSWLYVLVGKSGTADERGGTSPVRMLVAGSFEFKRVALVGDFISGPGGFGRAGLAYRIPSF